MAETTIFPNSKYIGETIDNLTIIKCVTNEIVTIQCICKRKYRVKIHDFFIGKEYLINRRYILKCNCNKKQFISRSREYRIWKGIISRCYNANNDAFVYYGERGITMCDEWKNSFNNFIEDMGKCPDNYSIDRLDSNKGYSKDNCRWANSKQQCNNRRNNKYIQFQGKIQTIKEWCSELKLDYRLTMERLYKKKYSVEKAFYREDLINNTRHINKLVEYTPANQKPNYNNNEFKNKL